ncbi:DUF4160 domain-containing protein [Dyadobacter endophyticus]|uniref:DUF4160 domain-containing protein n=1 Tax=Dyadobacter endophyticus TaxID=1749036 RepID=UPI0016683181|nr:DUF4160 domain-containing protein [Dyadobacter endophyticus]
MPEISRFFGIIIRMYFDDHNPPHFHAEFQEHRAIIDIQNPMLLDGYLSPKQLKLVQAWALIHQKSYWKTLSIWARILKAITRLIHFNRHALLHQKNRYYTRLRSDLPFQH